MGKGWRKDLYIRPLMIWLGLGLSAFIIILLGQSSDFPGSNWAEISGDITGMFAYLFIIAIGLYTLVRLIERMGKK